MDVSKPFMRELLIFGVGGLTMVASLSLLHRFRRPLGQGTLRLSSSRAGESPNPEWKAGVNQPIPYENKAYSSYLTSDLRKSGGLYGLGISAIVPRPIALVSSQNANGVLNCAPYSYFNIVSHDPPLVVIGNCINMRAQSKKDTLQNIEATGQFVVNIMSSWYVESANHCSGAFPPDVSEFELSGLSTLPSDLVKPPRVGEAAVQLECETYELKPILNDEGVHSVTLVIGRVVKFHVLQDVHTPESLNTLKPIVDWTKLKPVARMGGDTYTSVVNGFDISRPGGRKG